MIEGKRAIDDMFIEQLRINDEQHRLILSKLDDLTELVRNVSAENAVLNVEIKSLKKYFFGNGTKGVIQKTEEIDGFIREYKQDIKEIGKLKKIFWKIWGAATIIYFLFLIVVKIIIK